MSEGHWPMNDHTTHVIIEFHGGPLDRQTMGLHYSSEIHRREVLKSVSRDYRVPIEARYDSLMQDQLVEYTLPKYHNYELGYRERLDGVEQLVYRYKGIF